MSFDPSLLLLSATELARRIREGKLSSRDAVEAHIQQIERVNPTLNAVVSARFDSAREEAAEADRALAEGRTELPPFHGVPCSIKECFALTGMPQTSGLVARKGVIAVRDAPAVDRLRKAGAIPLGVTNVSELCMWMESKNEVYGRTNNPYDSRRTAGGSSGGEGAIVGAGGAPFGLGSDIGGSIRMPAFFNGVFGHKPSLGLVPNRGQYPMPDGPVDDYVVTGPIARRAEDLYPLLRVLAANSPSLRDPAEASPTKLRVLSVHGDGKMRVAPSLLDAQRRVEQALTSLGAQVETASFQGFRDALAIWSATIDATGGPSFAELLGNGTKVRAGRELLRWAVGRSPHTFPALALALVEPIPKLIPTGSARFVEVGRKLRAEVIAALGDDGVLLYPSHPRPAPRHMEPLLRPLGWVYTALFNALQLPVTQVPLGLDVDGVPLGVQVVTAPGNDHLSMAVALWLERDLGGWVPPRRWFSA